MEEAMELPGLYVAPEFGKKRRRMALWVKMVIALFVLTILGVALSFVVRSEWFLRGRIDPRLQALGKKLDGEFSYESVEPEGLTGVRIEGLTFEPNDDIDSPPISVRQLVVYPDLAKALTGELVPKRVEAWDVEVEVWLDGGPSGRGHWPWLEHVVEAWTQPSVKQVTGQNKGSVKQHTDLPELWVYGGRVSIKAPMGTMPELGAHVDEFVVRSIDGEVSLDGAIYVDGLGYTLLSGDASSRSRKAGVVVELTESHDLMGLAPKSDTLQTYVGPDSQLELGAVSLQWPPALVLHDVRLTDTHIGVPGNDTAFVEAIGARRLELGVTDGVARVHVDDFDAQVRLELFSYLTTSLPIRLPEVDLIADFIRQKIGVGFRVDQSEGGHLEVQTAIDLKKRDGAIRVDADKFDAGNLLALVPYTGPIEIHSGVLTGHAQVRVPLDSELVDVDMFMNVSGLDLDVPWLAEDRIENADITLDVHADIDLREKSLSIEDGMFSLGELMFAIDTKVKKLEGRHVDLDVHMSGADLVADDALESVPKGLLPTLEGYQLSGRFGFEFGFSLDTRDPDTLALDYDIDVSGLGVSRHGPAADIPLLTTDGFAVRVSAANKRKVLVGPAADTWTAFDRVPRHLTYALVGSEDGRFWGHNGFDTRAIKKSVVANLKAKGFVRGGSTISQQVIKNLYLANNKTLGRKLQEAFLTWQLELYVPKRRILELYFNLAHWGPGIYGIEEAAAHYFKRRPSKLHVREALFLSSILPSPHRFGDEYARGVIRKDRLAKMQRGLEILKRKGIVSSEAYVRHAELIRKAHISNVPRPTPLAEKKPDAAPAAKDAEKADEKEKAASELGASKDGVKTAAAL